MQGFKPYSTERNHYFTGRLLTAGDFQAEQLYMNHKRWLINRTLHGMGVVCGLHVAKANDQTLTIEAGLALDAFGREILVPERRTVKLRDIEGIRDGTFHQYVYLCIAYQESKKGQAMSANGATEPDRIVDGYRLFYRQRPPHPGEFLFRDWTHRTIVLHQDAELGLRVLQRAPRYVRMGQAFDVQVIVEKTHPLPHGVGVQLSLTDETQEVFAPVIGGPLQFREPEEPQGGSFTSTYRLRALHGESGLVPLDIGSLRITVGDVQRDVRTQEANLIKVLSSSQQAEAAFLREYEEQAQHGEIPAGEESCLYLARIGLMKTGSLWTADDGIEMLPYGGRLPAAAMLAQLEDLRSSLHPQLDWLSSLQEPGAGASVKPEPQAPPETEPEIPASELYGPPIPPVPELPREGTVRTGVVTISVREQDIRPFVRERSFLSQEIEHGLGAGEVCVQTGLVDVRRNPVAEMMQQEEAVFYGQASVFADTSCESSLPPVSTGTVVYPKKGTFRIGVRLDPPRGLAELQVRWWAYRV